MRDNSDRPQVITHARSDAVDAETAVAECMQSIDLHESCFVLVFAPSHLDLTELGQVLERVLQGVPAFGCTTAGQITGSGYEADALLLVSFPRRHFRCASVMLDELNDTTVGDIAEAAEKVSTRFRHTAGWSRLALLFSDGLAKHEDILASTLDTVMADVPVFGGSAGDGLNFGKTYVLHRGQFRSNAAVLLLVETNMGFKGLNFDHFLPTETQLVVTRADSEKRLVCEINGAPAAQEYARLIGRPVEQLSPEIFAENPMLVMYRNIHYVRAVQDVVDGTCLSFMAAIDDGLIMTLGRGQDMMNALRRGLSPRDSRGRTHEFILGFDCVLRKLEFEQKQVATTASRILQDKRVLGFSTYGEQNAGVHMNQTFVGVAFFEADMGDLF